MVVFIVVVPLVVISPNIEKYDEVVKHDAGFEKETADMNQI